MRESVHQPLLLICEDLHWIDSETQALLNLLADSIGTAKILLLVNYRPEYTHGWGNKTYYTQVRLDPLGRESAEEMLATLLGDTPELAARSGTLAQLVDSGLWRWNIAFSSGDVTAASALATQALALAAREGDPTRLAVAHSSALLTDCYRGDLTAVEERFTNGRAFFDDAGFRQLPTGSAQTPFAFASFGALQLGRLEVARERMAQVIAGADPNNPFGRAYAEMLAGILRHRFGEYAQAEALEAQALARTTLDTFGAVHLLVNNAGVGAGSSAWDSTLADWKWVIGVNLWGVIYGTRTFVPIMLKQNTHGHIVNVASVAGLVHAHPSAAYQVTKHAVVALSENTYHMLKMQNAKVKVSVLCPGWVRTRIMDSERNRPADLANPPALQQPTPEIEAILEEYRRQCEAGLDPAVVARMVFDGIRAERLYILTTTDFDPIIQERMDSILRRANLPSLPT